MSKNHNCYSQLKTKEGLRDLNTIIDELTKNNPNPIKLKEFTQKYGIEASKDPMQLMEEIILFLDQQKTPKIHPHNLV